ncbi:MAG: BTAD domain-containing putative transcriptional regulator [Labedaea sp.]
MSSGEASNPAGGDRSIQLGILGPLSLRRRGQSLTPSAPKLRQVLSLLAIQANSVTRVDQLVEELWEEHPPSSAMTTVQTYIYQLRKLLRLTDTVPDSGLDDEQNDGSPVLRSHPGGYILQVRALTDLDSNLFEQLAERGRQELLSGQVDVAADTFRVALGLWRGGVLEGVTTGPLLYAYATRLEERRRTVLGLRLESDLRLGRHQEITGELTSLVSSEPTREDFSAKLMIALYRSGRRADALQVYQRIRSVLVEELGLDPAAELQRLHQLMLEADPELDLAERVVTTHGGTTRAAAVTPAQLPPEIPDLVGRGAQLEQFERLLADGNGQGLRVLDVTGRPGVGKTAFAVCAARAVRSRFADGQVYVDLGGPAGSVRQVLVSMLKSLGANESDVPASTAEATLMFRSWTADRRLLLLLDGASSPDMLQHVLPGGSGCAVVVTSRVPMGGLPGAAYLKLPVLTSDESIELLTAVLGAARVARERDAAAELVGLADRLPLALRAVAAKLASRPAWPLRRMVDRLTDERTRLDELGYGGFDVSGRLVDAYQSLNAGQRWVFRRLAAATTQPLTVRELAELVSMRPAAVQNVLDELVDADLVEELETSEPRHRVPPLIRLVALSGAVGDTWWKTSGESPPG